MQTHTPAITEMSSTMRIIPTASKTLFVPTSEMIAGLESMTLKMLVVVVVVAVVVVEKVEVDGGKLSDLIDPNCFV